MNSIAIIPARSGSKGLKDKNIKLLNGKPLIWYSVKAAIDSNCFDVVMVSTDSIKYAEIARKCGASVPFLRSKEMSSDDSSSWGVVAEVLNNYKKIEKKFDYVMLLQPTSPLRTADDIKKAFSVLTKNRAKSVVSVCETEHSPLWSNVLPKNGCLDGFIKPEVKEMFGRQKLPIYYRVNGAIYLTKISEKLEKDLYTAFSYAYIMPQNRSIDIDTELDFKMAEFLLQTQEQ